MTRSPASRQRRDRRRADAAAAAVHQRAAAVGRRAEHEEVEERGEEDLGQRAGLLVATAPPARASPSRRAPPPPPRSRRRRAAPWRDRRPPAAHRGADLDHLAGALEPEDRRRAGRRRVHALPLQQVGAVHRRGAHADAQRRRGPAPGAGASPSCSTLSSPGWSKTMRFHACVTVHAATRDRTVEGGASSPLHPARRRPPVAPTNAAPSDRPSCRPR